MWFLLFFSEGGFSLKPGNGLVEVIPQKIVASDISRVFECFEFFALLDVELRCAVLLTVRWQEEFISQRR